MSHIATMPARGGSKRIPRKNIVLFRNRPMISWMNPWCAAQIQSDGPPDWLFSEVGSARSQGIEKLFCPIGAIWAVTTQGLRVQRTFYEPGHALLPMPCQTAIDMDDMDDLEMAEALAQIATFRKGLPCA